MPCMISWLINQGPDYTVSSAINLNLPRHHTGQLWSRSCSQRAQTEFCPAPKCCTLSGYEYGTKLDNHNPVQQGALRWTKYLPLTLSWLWHGEQITNSRGVCFKSMNHITLALNVQCLDSIDCMYRPASQGQLSETWSCAAVIKAHSLLEGTCFYTWSFPEQPCKGTCTSLTWQVEDEERGSHLQTTVSKFTCFIRHGGW